MASASGLSRSALEDIERDAVLPSLGVIWRVAVGLDLPFAELLRGDDGGAAVLRRAEVQELWSADGVMRSRPLIPVGACRSVEAYELMLKAHSAHRAEPHATGTSEVIVVLQGELRLDVDGRIYELSAGDSAAYRADVGHVYENPGPLEAYYHNLILYQD